MTFPDSTGTRDFPDAAVHSPHPRSSWRGFSSLRRAPQATLLLALSGCVLFSAVLAFTALGSRPLVSPGEARYALIAREMLESALAAEAQAIADYNTRLGQAEEFGDFGLKVVLEHQVADETRHKEELERIIAGWDER